MLPITKTSKLTFLTKSSIPFAVVVLKTCILLGGDFNCPLTEVGKVGGRDILHKKRTI